MNEPSPVINNLSGIDVFTLFQPLYSVQQKKYIGVEALSRGLRDNKLISAGELFDLPENAQENLILNRKCIKAAFRNFKEQVFCDDCAVFINFDSSLMDCSLIEEGHILKTALYEGVDPSKIVIELIESKVKSFDTLMRFVNYYKAHGFLIALDDVGAGYSSFERIARIQPDIIKIDRSLVSNVSEDFHKREVCRALIGLSHNIGALSLAEGVEELDDALVCQELGADIIQGFYFSTPKKSIELEDISKDKIDSFVNAWSSILNERRILLKENIDLVKERVLKIENMLLHEPVKLWNDLLLKGVEKENIECAYIIDSKGLQISNTAMRSDLKCKKHSLFAPAKFGTDHSLKSYFAQRHPGQEWFISDPYISRATGLECRTVSKIFIKDKNKEYYLCLDIKN